MLLDTCLKKINIIRETSLSIKRLEHAIYYQDIECIEEKDNINDLLMKINKNYTRDLKCKLSSCMVEIQVIEDELLYQACIRIQMFFRKSVKFYFMKELLSLDTIYQYKRYLASLKDELLDTRLNIMSSDDDLISFKNDYILTHIKYINTSLIMRDYLVSDYEEEIRTLHLLNKDNHLYISKMSIKMTLSDIMKIQAHIKCLSEYPDYMKLLDDFIIHAKIDK
jgi:hypothetical protein